MRVGDGRQRVVISGVLPAIDDGRYPIKRIVGERVTVEADVFGDGHDAVAGALLYRAERTTRWTRVPLRFLGNDRWRASFTVTEEGGYRYTIEAWVDHFSSWRRDLAKRVEAGQDVDVDLEIGAGLVRSAAGRATGKDAKLLEKLASVLTGKAKSAARIEAALSEELAEVAGRWPDLTHAVRYDRSLPVCVDRERAGFSSWYEVFPRSTSPEPGRHGTFADLSARLPYIADMGFDVVYLPPIHPIGVAFRKGPNNNPAGGPDDIGSPWAIGGKEGGHKAIHSDLGTFEDFTALVARTKELGMEIALDLAFQCSPDHPYVAEHPGWFRARPDGTIQYAENPPKKYQDIYPFDFECEDWEGLWEELRSVVEFWVERGVRIFRVDNPHTKSFPFWEWLIADVKETTPGVIFLAEAFTRPKVMYQLAKAGFTQSYTYFTWRNNRREFEEYMMELTRSGVREFFRPNFWPNTPDILPEHLQIGGRPAFLARLVLAATLSPNYGMYGPAFELLEHVPVKTGSEEYLDSEKYQLRHWDLDDPKNIRDVIAAVNRIRRENAALQTNRGLRFHRTSNDEMFCYSKVDASGENVVLVVVNMDTSHVHSALLDLDLSDLGLSPDAAFTVEDLLSGARFQWQGPKNYVELRPTEMPAHIFRVVGRPPRREGDFEYYQ